MKSMGPYYPCHEQDGWQDLSHAYILLHSMSTEVVLVLVTVLDLEVSLSACGLRLEETG